jgi:hypothetical protein
MKQKFSLLAMALLLALSVLKAQPGTVYFATETGDKFTLFINGQQQNPIPALQVEARNVSGTVIPCTIVFENPALRTINGNIGRNDVDVAFVISKDASGNFLVYQKQTATTLSNGVTISGTSSSGNTTTVKTNGGYVESVKSGQVEATDHSVKTDKFSVSSNVSVKVKTPGLPEGMGPMPTAEEIDQARTVARAYQNSNTTTTTTTTTTTSGAPQQTNPKGNFYFESEGIDSFYLWFNNVKVNETPQMSVVVRDITDGWISMRVEFSDRANRPCSKSMARWGRDCYYAIQRNNKGEHIIKLKNAVGDLKTPAPETTQVTTVSSTPTSTFTFTSAPVTTSTTTTRVVATTAAPAAQVNVTAAPPVAAGPLKAELQGNKIVLSDGRKYTLNSFAGNSEAPHIKMAVLQGTKVTLDYADGLDGYNGTPPFDFVAPKGKYAQPLTLTVNEGSADKTWQVKIPCSTWHWVSIE